MQWATRQSQSIIRPTDHKKGWCQPIDRSHVTTAIWWPLGVAVVSVTCMRVCWVSHTWKYIQWNIFLFESSDKSPYWTDPYHMGFRYEAPLTFHTYFGQCTNDTYILLHVPLHICPNYPHTGLTTATAPSGHQMAVVTCDRSIGGHVSYSTDSPIATSPIGRIVKQCIC